MPLLRKLLLALCLLALTGPTLADRPPSACQSPVEAETAAALAREGITEPALALTGVGQSAAARGGEWLVVGWRPCLAPEREPEGGVSTVIKLYHRADKAKPRPVAAITLPSELAYVSPSEDPVVETAFGPLLLIEAATGGNCMGCEKLLPLRLDSDRLIPVEPQDGRIALREVTASDPDLIITGFLNTFESYGPLCHACSPSTTIHLKLEKGGRLTEACDRSKDDYASDALAAKDELAALADSAAKGSKPDSQAASDLFAGAIARTLDRLNAGESATAVLPDFQSTVEKAKSVADSQLTREIDRAALAVVDELTNAGKAGRLNRSCPALGLNRPQGF